MADAAAPGEGFTLQELQLATRNRGMPLEGLRYDLTPVGMHYLLVHFDVPAADEPSWRLAVDGAFAAPLTLTMDDIRSMPATTMPVTMECAGNGRARLEPRPLSQPWLLEALGTAEWTGTSLAGVLAEAGLSDDVADVVFTGSDRGVQGGVEQDYQRALSPDEATRPEVLLAYEMNGRPLEPQHGFPLRLVVPGWYGMASVKWLTRITATTRPFAGYQHEAYRYVHEEGEDGIPVTRMRVRALMMPPGIPDFFERTRVADAGPVPLFGRAWSGSAPVERVEVGIDGTWAEATLGPSAGPWAWRSWTHTWQATPGRHVVACRATDATGATQPDEQPWNVHGMGNNLIQEVVVTVR